MNVETRKHRLAPNGKFGPASRQVMKKLGETAGATPTTHGWVPKKELLEMLYFGCGSKGPANESGSLAVMLYWLRRRGYRIESATCYRLVEPEHG